MENICIVLIVLHLFSSPQALSDQTVTRVVRPGDKVTLFCSIEHKNQTLWCGQQSNKLPFVILSAKQTRKEILNQFYKGFNNGFTTTVEYNRSISLTIDNMTESFLALYYCTSGVGDETVVGSGHLLAFDENLDESLICLPESSGQSWVLAAILGSLSAAVAALLAFFCSWMFHRKGKIELERPRIDQRRNDNVQGREEGVHYSALRFSNGDRRGKGKNTYLV